MTKNGLEEGEWRKVLSTLEIVVDYYDRMNDFATFLQAEKWRRIAAKYSSDDLDVLEVGCGPGSFAKHLKARKLVCIDPSEKLLDAARKQIGSRAEFILGKAEDSIFDREQFDRVFCSFSFRDLRDQIKSLRNFFLLLRKNGMLIILDIAKYDSGLRSSFMNFHIRFVVPFIARIVIPWNVRKKWDGNPYDNLWQTYKNFKTPEQIANDVRASGFNNVEIRILSIGGAFLIIAEK